MFWLNYTDMLIKERFPNEADVLTEIINLEAIQNLPKGTEMYISDIHGEFDAFDHILRIGSGNVKEKIIDLFGKKADEKYVNELALIISYPKYALENGHKELSQDIQGSISLIEDLIGVLRFASAKYTRSKVRKALPEAYRYVIEELLYADYSLPHKKDYAEQIMLQLIEMEKLEDFIEQLSYTIQNLVIDHIHIVGDVFDRGSDADKVMDKIMELPSVDIQWGNHDIIWLGAYYGSVPCLLTLLRIAARYNYLFDIERSYGINLRPLFSFAKRTYESNPAFTPKGLSKQELAQGTKEMEQVHQALSMMQFKVEEQLIKRRPEFKMNRRLLLEAVNYENKTVEIEGTTYDLTNTCFQTVDPECPSKLTTEEKQVIEELMSSFQNSVKMKTHMEYMIEKGSNYLIYNQHLLFHACIPLEESGQFMPFEINGESYKGKALLDFFDKKILEATENKEIYDDQATDLFWYLWCGDKSPLFGKSKMTTFERYFIEDKDSHTEHKNPYFKLRSDAEVVDHILKEFGLEEEISAIINGHTPVNARKGEDPIKVYRKLFVIDGGLSKAYQGSTGIAGYSLLNNSFGFQVVTHNQFTSVEDLFDRGTDGTYVKRVVESELERVKIEKTTIGCAIKKQIKGLKEYLATYY